MTPGDMEEAAARRALEAAAREILSKDYYQKINLRQRLAFIIVAFCDPRWIPQATAYAIAGLVRSIDPAQFRSHTKGDE